MQQTLLPGGLFDHAQMDLKQPTPLYQDGDRGVYWLGITDETAFRCNTYLIKDQGEVILVDPGSRAFFDQVRARTAQIVDPARVTGMILCHQDPDVAASMVDWLDVNPEMRVFSSPRTHVLLPHYGRADYRAYDVVDAPRFDLPSGGFLQFVEAPFLHFPGAFATYDSRSGYLYSGDVWAALDTNWRLIVKTFDEHVPKLDLFHIEYMASNIAVRGFVRALDGLSIKAILPQHGSIIGPAHVAAALRYLEELQCGTDLLYPDLPSYD